MSDTLLQVSNLSQSFGGITALNKVSFEVKSNSITALIGPNGAGKTTLFNCLTGFYRANQGDILLNNAGMQHDLRFLLGPELSIADTFKPFLLGKKLYYKALGGSHLIARQGVARTFQNIRLFQNMSVIENCLVAEFAGRSQYFFSGLFNLKSFKKAERSALENAYHLLDLLGLADKANTLARELPYGMQRRLEIARCLCINPKLLCLDEPAAGLNPKESEALCKIIETLRTKHHLTILIIEHDMKLVMSISDTVVVLAQGEVIAKGSPEAVQQHPQVISAYLGQES